MPWQQLKQVQDSVLIGFSEYVDPEGGHISKFINVIYKLNWWERKTHKTDVNKNPL